MAQFNINNFLKPESMVTPGVAGGIAMLIANTMYVNFGLPPSMTCLVVSFMMGTLVFSAVNMKIWTRSVFYVLNSLIIFSMAAGTNYAGTKLTGAQEEVALSPTHFEISIIPTAHASNHDSKAVDDKNRKSKSESSTASGKKASDDKTKSNSLKKADKKKRSFFNMW